MSREDFPGAGGESLYEALQTIIRLPEAEKGDDGFYTFYVPDQKKLPVFAALANSSFADLMPVPRTALYQTFINTDVPRLDTVRVKYFPDTMCVKYSDSVEHPWVYVSCIYCHEFERPGLVEQTASVAVGVELLVGYLVAGRQSRLYVGDQMFETYVRDVQRMGHLDDVQCLRDIAWVLSQPNAPQADKM